MTVWRRVAPLPLLLLLGVLAFLVLTPSDVARAHVPGLPEGDTRAYFGLSERHTSGACSISGYVAPSWINAVWQERWLDGPEVVYRGQTYEYAFHHEAVVYKYVASKAGCRWIGRKTPGWVGIFSGTGSVSPYHTGSANDAAWLERAWDDVHPGNIGHPHEYTTDGVPSSSYRTNSFHRTVNHYMKVRIPNNAPRGSTFHTSFFQPDANGWSTGAREYGPGGGFAGTVYTVAPVPDAPGKPRVAWGPTRNSARIEFPANTHDGADRIFSYGVEVRRYFSDTDTWTDWTWKANVEGCSSGTCSALVTGLAGTSHYQVRVFARARLNELGETIYYSPVSDEFGFNTRSTADPDPPTGLRADEVFYNRVGVEWSAPGYTGWYSDPVYEYTIQVRRWAGSFWTPWGWAAAVGGSTRSETVTGYFEYGTFKPFEPGNTYLLRVAAKIRRQGDESDVLWSAWSETLQIKTLSPVPVAPQRPWKTELTHDSVRVSWHPLTNDGAGRIYSWGVQTRLWIPLPVGTWTPWVTVANPGRDTRSVVLSGLSPDTDYQVRVFARARTSPQSETFWSPTSPVEGIKTRTLRPSAPEAPVLSNPQTLPQRIDVSWSAPEWGGATPIHDYDLEVYVGNAWRGSVPNAGGTGTSLTLTGYRQGNADVALEPGAEYRVRVRANNLDSGGNVRNGDWSDPSSFVETLPGAPGAPAAPTLSQVGSVSVRVSWNAPDFVGASPIHDYDVEVRQRQDDGTWGAWAASHPAHHGATRSLTLFGLNHYGGGDPIDFSPSTDYQVRLRANNQERDADGNVTGTRRGTWSEATEFRTAPGVPTDLFTIPGDGSVRLLWEQPAFASGEAGFRYAVEHADNAQFTGAQTAETTAGSVVVTNSGERVLAADWALLPAGVEEGQRFRLLFVTSGSTTSQSTDIATYNAFVKTQATGGHAAIVPFADDFRALVCTDAVDGRDNAGTTGAGVPIYWVNGAKAADDYADFHDGSWDSNAPRTQTGAGAGHPNVKTGCSADGTGADEVGGNSATYGLPATAGQEIDSGGTRATSFSDRLYALSPVLVAASPPPPTELTVTGLTNGTETHLRVRAVRGTAAGDWSEAATATPTGAVDYDADNDGLIEIRSLAQLNAVRWDLDGDGAAADAHEIDYLSAFPVPMPGMGCPVVVGDSGGCSGYELMADLDFDGSDWASGDGWLPIGHTGNNEDPSGYGAVFDGNGRTIANLFIDRDGLTRVGLFSAVEPGGVVEDVGLPDADVTGNDGVGALAGVNDGTVRRSWSSGQVAGSASAIGGLVGWNGSGHLIENSWSSAAVSSSDARNLGGLVGRNLGSIRGSYASGAVSTDSGINLGGLVGLNDDTGSITASYAAGSVSSTVVTATQLGGLVGENSGAITDSYAVGAVTDAGLITGGLVGWHQSGSITNSYVTGTVTGANISSSSRGAIVGRKYAAATVTGSSWNRDTVGRTFGIGDDDNNRDDSVGGTETNSLPGRTTAELQAPTDNTGIYAGWNADSWDFGADYNYPALKADHDGDGTATWQEFGNQRGPGPVTGLRAALEDRSGEPTLAVTWSPPTDRGSSDAAGLAYRLRQSIDGGPLGSYVGCADTGVSCGAQGGSWETSASAGVNAVEVQSLGNAVHGFGATASIGPPGAPDDLAVLVYDTALGLTWAAPDDDGGAAVDSYRVQYRAGTSGGWTTWEMVEEDIQIQRTATPGAADSNAVTTTDTTEENGVTTTVTTSTSTRNGVTHVLTTTETSTAVIAGTEALIEELTTDTAYQVRVAAVSVLGTGTWAQETATPDTTARAPSAPRNVAVTPGDGTLTVTWYPPADLGNPGRDVIQYVLQIKPTTGRWDCDDPDTEQPYTGDEDDLPTWVQIYCMYDGDASPAGYYSPEGGWTTRDFNRATPQPDPFAGLPYSLTFRFLENGVAYQVRVAAQGLGEETVLPGPGVMPADPLLGPWSDEVGATPGTPAGAAERLPGVPRNLRLIPGDQRVTALWELPADLGNPDLDGYVVQWREVTTPESEWTRFVTDSADADLDELTNGAEYQVRVAAYHNTLRDDGGGVRVVLAAADVPEPPAGEQPLAECPATGLREDCYVVIQAGNIGPYTAVATAAPGALAQEDIVADDPAMPRNLRLVPGVGQITAHWDAPSEPDPGHAGYAVQYRPAGTSRWLDGPRIIDTAARSAVIAGLEGRAYQVRVASLIAHGAGHVSGSFTAPRTMEAVAPRVPGAPRNLAAVVKVSPNDGSRRIEVSWNPPTDRGNPAGITGYSVQYRPTGASVWTDWNRPDREAPTSTRTVLTGIDTRRYEVRVAAIGVLGNIGAYAVSGQAHHRPTEPTNLTLIPGDGQIRATWDAPDDPGNPPIGGYYVSYRNADAGSADGVTLGWRSAWQTGTAKTFTGLTNGREYQVRVSVSNSAGAASAILSATPTAQGGDPVTGEPPPSRTRHATGATTRTAETTTEP